MTSPRPQMCNWDGSGSSDTGGGQSVNRPMMMSGRGRCTATDPDVDYVTSIAIAIVSNIITVPLAAIIEKVG
jgi:hypothetical protein